MLLQNVLLFHFYMYFFEEPHKQTTGIDAENLRAENTKKQNPNYLQGLSLVPYVSMTTFHRGTEVNPGAWSGFQLVLCFITFHFPPGAFAKVKESQRMSDEGKMNQDEADGIRKRCRTVGFALQAEMSHFHQQREVDFKDMMQAYLREQIAFYQRVVQQLERTLRMYDCL